MVDHIHNTTTPLTSRFSFSRMGLFKSQSASPSPLGRSQKVQDDSDNWYIPYNGPYEAPQRTYAGGHEKNRDSWGDPVDEAEQEDPFLGDVELHNRYGGHKPRTPTSAGWNVPDERKGRPRARTQSSASGRTVSSGTVDPGRASMATGRRSTVSHGSNRPPVPSYVNLDTSGGVGESPVPHQRVSRDTSSTKRKSSLASLFTFNTSSKKHPPSPKVDRSFTPNPPSRSTGRERPSSGLSKRTALPHLPSDPVAAAQILRDSAATDEEDYYNSYYQTLIHQPKNNHDHQSPDTSDLQPPLDIRQPSPKSGTNSPVSELSSPHPYAYAFSTALIPPETPSSAPPPKTHFDRVTTYRVNPEKSRIIPPQQIVNSSTIPQVTIHPPGHSLKNSISTPDLRKADTGRSTLRKKAPTPKGKDRWLSAETWCDALLFPRPRFKVKQDKDALGVYSGSGRIVSPPGSPIFGYFAQGGNPNGLQPSVASRVLAHSRSLVDLTTPGVAGPSTLPKPKVPPERHVGKDEQQNLSPTRPYRPKSWALDDLALPSPVPSLARVLEEGQILEHQRKKWQAQAVNSFQNKRARSLSRARTKSMTNKQPKKTDTSRLDFLAARGLLGDQNVIPVNVIKPRQRSNSQSQTDSRGTTVGRTSHTHTSSLSKTISKTSKSHSRTHSRSESVGKSAAKIAKATATVLCGYDGEGLSPAEEKGNLEGALQNDTTRVIRLADPAQIHVESPLLSSVPHSASPTPSGVSGISDSRMGIALTTPPHTDETFESMRIPAHPYAQGGLSVYSPYSDNRAGPSTSTSHRPAQNHNHNHKQSTSYAPPAWHPYAQAGSSRDSYQSEVKIIKHQRSDSSIPPPEKMWAQWSSGVVREILPNEIQYSPLLPDQRTTSTADDSQIRKQVRNSSPIYDTVGVGETLVMAMQTHHRDRDSGIGTSEEHTPQQVVEHEEGSVSRHRKQVQYDATRPLYLQKYGPAGSPRRVAALQTPPVEPSIMRQHSAQSSANNSTGNVSNDSSPPASPPPPLGNVDDLANFHDLFYRPTTMSRTGSGDGVSLPVTQHSNGVPWDVTSNDRRGSGLTSIARQLTEDLHDSGVSYGGSGSLKHSISLRSQSSLSALRHSRYDALTPPADSNIHFVFSDIPDTASVNTNGERKNMHANILTFKPSIQIPEDVDESLTSSRASSPTRSPIDNDGQDVFRVGNVESVSTPPAVSGENRTSFAGQMAFALGEDPQSQRRDHNSHSTNSRPSLSAVQSATTHSSLQPPPTSSTDPTRTSYMTTSDGSRMSGLSDFPDPPPQMLTPAHMSLLSSYFDDTITAKEIADVRAYGHVKPATRSRSGSVLTSRAEGGPSRAEPVSGLTSRAEPVSGLTSRPEPQSSRASPVPAEGEVNMIPHPSPSRPAQPDLSVAAPAPVTRKDSETFSSGTDEEINDLLARLSPRSS